MRIELTSHKIVATAPDFPHALTTIPDPPSEIYVSGMLPELSPVAIVGSRQATAYGKQITTILATRLAKLGVPIVSGLAFGIDATSHTAMLEAGGRSIAVLPSGLASRVVSPQRHLRLAHHIIKNGALVSEYPDSTSARKEHYLARNRLISGLADHVIIVEAALPSGSLVTAKHAAEQGKEVWAVPGPITSATSRGTNELIFQGAQPLTDIDEFIESLGFDEVSRESPIDPILKLFSSRPTHLDTVFATATVPPKELRTAVTKLELTGQLNHLGGNYYVLS